MQNSECRQHAPVFCLNSAFCILHFAFLLYASTDSCCEIFRSTPTQSRLTSSDDPPLLSSGSGMPLVGSSPSTTLMLTNAWATIIVVIPTAVSDPKRSSALAAITSPRHAITQKHSSVAVVP